LTIVHISAQGKERAAHDRLRKARAEYGDLQKEVNDFMPANIAGLQAAKEVRTNTMIR
jgi:hypothetical protein